MAINSLNQKKDEVLLHQDNSLVEFQQTLKEAVEIMNHPPQVYEFLKKPMRFLEVSIPVKMDNGQVEIFEGYRAQHNDAAGPTKGGIRFHPDVTPEEVNASYIPKVYTIKINIVQKCSTLFNTISVCTSRSKGRET